MGSARSSLIRAKAAVDAGRFDDARNSLSSASANARRADARLRSFAPRLLGYIPVAGRPVRSAQMLIQATSLAADGARDGLAVFPERSPWRGGTLDLTALQTMREAAAKADTRLREAASLAHRSPGWPLPAAVRDARRQLISELDKQASTVSSARKVLEVLPDIAGASGPRRYFVVFQNPTELRGTGGLWGNHAFLDASGGRLDLGSFGRPQRDLAPYATTRGPDWYEARYGELGGSKDWRQLPMAPDFPTVASLAAKNLTTAPGLGPVNGVIAMDPVGLAALLKLTGPVRVPGWPEPIDANNVVRITLHDAYIVFESDRQRRIDFLNEVTQATWARLRQTDIPLSRHALRGLGEAVSSRRFLFYLTDTSEQRQIAAVGADGALEGRNTFALVTQNTAVSKMDYWLKRRVSLTFRLREDESASVTSTVALTNGGNGAGQPDYVAGPANHPLFKQGWQQQFASLYVPDRAVDDARPGDVPIGREEEPGFATASRYVDIPPLAEEKFTSHFTIRSIWDAKRGVVRVTFRRQPSLAPDGLRVEIVPPKGWRVVNDRGAKDRRAGIFRASADRDVVISMKLSRN